MKRRQPPVVRVVPEEECPLPAGTWPRSIPAVEQLLGGPMVLAPGVTFLVGENGSGKSTLVEAIALAYGMGAEGGSIHSRLSTRESESQLHQAIWLQRGIGAQRWGFFLRAETMHNFYTYLEENPRVGGPPDLVFHEMSHGESFLAMLEDRFRTPGFYCLDEPEAALSFTSTLALMRVLDGLVRRGGQVVCATHSPVLAALPGAVILEVGEWGMRQVAWEDLELVHHWRRFLDVPGRYLRELLGSPEDA